jgi:hypothetical protein
MVALEGLALLPRYWKLPQIPTCRLAILTEVVVIFFIASEKCMDNIQYRQQPLLSTSFAVDYSVIIQWFDAE